MARIELQRADSPDQPVTLLGYVTSGTAGGRIALRAPSPAPPGARLDAIAIDESGRSPFRVKVHRCKRMDDGTFVILGATQELRRDGRAILEALSLAAPGIPPGL